MRRVRALDQRLTTSQATQAVHITGSPMNNALNTPNVCRVTSTQATAATRATPSGTNRSRQESRLLVNHQIRKTRGTSNHSPTLDMKAVEITRSLDAISASPAQ